MAKPTAPCAATSASVSSTCIRQPDVIEMTAATVSSPAATSQPSLTIGESVQAKYTITQSAATTEVDHAGPAATAVVGELVRADEPGGFEVVGQFVANVVGHRAPVPL